MNTKRFLSFIALSSALVFGLTGCNGTDPETEGEEPPVKAVAFDGSPDERLAAVWKTTDGKSTYTLLKDGSYKMHQKAGFHGSNFESNTKGEWKVKGSQVLIKGESGVVVPYDYKLEGGKTLTLTSSGSLKSKTVLNKQ